METNLLLILSLLFVVSLLSMLSNKLGIAYPIFLVIAGLVISLVPDIPNISLDPHIVFVIFLPPLLYAAAWNTSWKEFWALKRPIGLLAFGLVFFTSIAIAYLSNAIIPGFTLSLGFLLGGIISPPDAVAATSIISRLKVPKRVVNILEGESLVNDASSLIVFKFALGAILTGQFVMLSAGVDFLIAVGMGIFVGTAIAAFIYMIHRFLPTDPAIDTAISLIAPYIMYLVAEHFSGSGVLAVVSGGLFLSHYSNHYFNYESRMQVNSVWNTLVFILNGVVFILIGLQLPYIIQGLETYSTASVIGYAVIISIASVAIRIIWVYPATYLPRILSKKIRENEKRPSIRNVFIIAWSGMRGVVSLASALTIPLVMENGEMFPHRNLILFLTFSVILFTLILQGLTLPLLIRVLKIKVDDTHEASQKLMLSRELTEAVVSHLNNTYPQELQTNEVYQRVQERYSRILEEMDKRAENLPQKKTGKPVERKMRLLLLELIEVQRTFIENMRREGQFADELLRNKEYDLDLEEARVRRTPV